MKRQRRAPVNTDKQVERLKPEAAKFAVRVRGQPGLYVRVTPTGHKSFAVAVLGPQGQKWATLDTAFTIEEARAQARDVIPRIKAGQPPFPPAEPAPESFKAVAENFMARHVKKKGLRSEGEIRRCLEKYIYPILSDREFISIRRSDVASLLDFVEDRHGPRQADVVLSYIRQIMKWYEDRDDSYVCPVSGRMRRTDPASRRRSRKLDDHEIQLLWKVADGSTFGGMAKIALLTGQRRSPIASMRWQDVSVDGTWHIPTEERRKGTGETLPLPELALEVLKGQRRLPGNPYIFTGRAAEEHFTGFSMGKKILDERMTQLNGGEPLPQWQFHDLRRTCRSLLARAGVSQEVAERVLGHTQDPIIETYDVHNYEVEKGQALAKLEGLLKLILEPPEGENVVPMGAAAR